MLTAEQFHAFQNEPIYGWNSLALLGDVEDFLDFSEANIGWQAKRELRSVDDECDGMEFEDPLDAMRYREQRVESVEYRFNVSLTQRIRYSGLTAVITTIEWSLIALNGCALSEVPVTRKGKRKRKRKSLAVHLLGDLAEQCGENLMPQVKELEVLTQVRNCVVHSAGYVKSYRYEKELRSVLDGHRGIRLSNSNYLGESVEIDIGFLQEVIGRAKKWLPGLQKSMREKGLLRT